MTDPDQTADQITQAEALAKAAREMSLMIFHYPRVLNSARESRFVLDRLAAELEQHARQRANNEQSKTVFRVSAAHPYDNWRCDFGSLEEALAMVRADPSHCVHNVMEILDGRIMAKHGTWRAGKQYAGLREATNNVR